MGALYVSDGVLALFEGEKQSWGNACSKKLLMKGRGESNQRTAEGARPGFFKRAEY